MFVEKRMVLLAGLIFIWISGKASPWWKTDTLYYNNEFKVCQDSAAVFYRIGTRDTLRNLWIAGYTDYNLRHQLLRKGFKDPVNGREDGYFAEYHSSGKVSREGHFILDHPSGKWTTYHPNGRIEMVLYFSDRPDSLPIVLNDPFQVWEFYDEKGNPLIYNGTGRWEYDFPDQGLNVSGYFKEGKKAGMWRFLNEKGQLLQEEFYDEGNFRFANTFRQGKFEKTDESWLNATLFKPVTISEPGTDSPFEFQHYPEFELSVGFSSVKSEDMPYYRLPDILLAAFLEFREDAQHPDSTLFLQERAYFMGLLENNGTFRLEGIISDEGISKTSKNTWQWNHLGYAVPFKEDYLLIFPIHFSKPEIADNSE